MSIQPLIEQALSVMDETDLAPKTVRKKRDKGYAPATYHGKNVTPPLTFDADQGWEVATKQGARLDLAIRNVGSAVEERAMALRQPLTLTLEQITEMRAD